MTLGRTLALPVRVGVGCKGGSTHCIPHVWRYRKYVSRGVIMLVGIIRHCLHIVAAELKTWIHHALINTNTGTRQGKIQTGDLFPLEGSDWSYLIAQGLCDAHVELPHGDPLPSFSSPRNCGRKILQEQTDFKYFIHLFTTQFSAVMIITQITPSMSTFWCSYQSWVSPCQL